MDNFLKNVGSDKSADARSFYVNYWGDILSNSIHDYTFVCGKYKNYYSPDTIYSFYTLAGVIIRALSNYVKNTMPKENSERLSFILNSNDVSHEQRKIIKDFYSVWTTNANFMPLAYGVNYGKKGASLDFEKGSNFHDLPERFLNKVNDEYVSGFYGEVFAHPFIKQYFQKFDTLKGNAWKDYVELNYLQDLFIDDFYTRYVNMLPTNINFAWNETVLDRMSDSEKKSSIEATFNYFEKATRIIEKRAKRLESL